MRILIVEPEKHPREAEIADSLESMQEVVGGKIQALYPFDDSAAIVCNEEANNLNLPKNRAIYSEDGKTVATIVSGTFFVCDAPDWSEHFLSLSAEQFERYSALFAIPEIFVSSKRFTMVIRCDRG